MRSHAVLPHLWYAFKSKTIFIGRLRNFFEHTQFIWRSIRLFRPMIKDVICSPIWVKLFFIISSVVYSVALHMPVLFGIVSCFVFRIFVTVEKYSYYFSFFVSFLIIFYSIFLPMFVLSSVSGAIYASVSILWCCYIWKFGEKF